MRKTYTFEIIWTDGTQRRVINTFKNQKTRTRAESWRWAYIKENGYIASEFILKKTAEPDRRTIWQDLKSAKTT